MVKRPHYAGTEHVVPLDGTSGHARVVARGCRVDHPSGYFADTDSAECGHGYTWDCGSCPVLPDLNQCAHDHVYFLAQLDDEVPHV